MVLTRCIQSKTLYVISHFVKTFGHILFRLFCFVVQACRIAGFCFLLVSSIYENWSISTTKHMQNRTVFISLPNRTHKLIVRQNSYFTCSYRQSRRDQWSSSQVTARGQRQLLRPNDQNLQAKSLQLRPSQSNF